MDIDVSALKALVREKELSLDLVVESIEQALLVAYHRTEGATQTSRVTLDRKTLNEIVLGTTTLEKETTAGKVKIEGDEKKLGELVALLDKFDFWFNIVTP